MKNLKLRISAIMALLLAGTIIASASTPVNNPSNIVTKNDSTVNVEEALTYDDHYLDQIDAYVDQYLLEATVEFLEIEHVKVFGSNQELLVDGVKGQLDQDQLKLLRQADLLSELNGTAYYQINN
ncbi:MAG TPA: hypothetical protein VIN11_04575 [Roseivirga sp.]